jgi:multicomponent Na+:H+ antiporter subunit E
LSNKSTIDNGLRKDTARRKASSGWRTKWTVTIFQFLILYAFWILLSERFQLKYLIIGFFVAALVTWLTSDMIYNPRTRGVFTGSGELFRTVGRYILYVPWLVWAIVKANIQIALIILNPRLPIDPGFIQFTSHLECKIARVTLANSITLTPGTITTDIKKKKLIVHFLVPESAADLETGVFQNRVSKVFSEQKDVPGLVKYAHSIEELDGE